MLNELAKEIRQDNEAKGFFWSPEDVPTMLLLIHSEVSEATENFRDNLPLDEELADIIIRVLDMSAVLNIDISNVVRGKIWKNKQRPFRHGRKRF